MPLPVLFAAFILMRDHAAFAQSCGTATPLSMPIRNVSLSASVIRRGVDFRVGTPAQSFGLAVNADWNNTYLYTTSGQCTNLSDSQCIFSRGGVFDSLASSSFTLSSDPSAAEFRAADNGALSITSLGEDHVDSSDMELNQLPLFTPTSGTLPESGLGLGRNSTLLYYLHNTGRISSQTWSLFWGLEGSGSPKSTQMDGSLVLGGYDAAKITGENMTQGFSSLEDMKACPSSLIVFLTDVQVNFPNGTATSLFGTSAGTAMRSCIKPDIPLITFPQNVWQAFSDAIGGSYIAPSESYKLWGMDYSINGIFDGNLTFTLSSGLTLTIPNDQLVVPDVQVNNNGQMFTPNSGAREILIYNLENSNVNDMPLLGQVFLSSVYLHVNNDDQEFKVWQANPTTKEKLVAVSGSSTVTCNPTSNPTSNSTSTPENPPSNASSSRRIIIIGVVVIVAVAIAFAMCVFWWRRVRQRKQARVQTLSDDRRSLAYDTYKEMTTEAKEEDEGRVVRSGRRWHEMPGPGHGNAHELHSQQVPFELSA